MGADNWAICPKCLARERADRERKKQKAQEAYGKVPIEEFERLRMIAGERIELSPTLREDYEIGTDSGGRFKVSYRAHCSICKLDIKCEYTKFVLADSKE